MPLHSAFRLFLEKCLLHFRTQKEFMTLANPSFLHSHLDSLLLVAVRLSLNDIQRSILVQVATDHLPYTANMPQLV